VFSALAWKSSETGADAAQTLAASADTTATVRSMLRNFSDLSREKSICCAYARVGVRGEENYSRIVAPFIDAIHMVFAFRGPRI
jgi:hypothetical protein